MTDAAHPARDAVTSQDEEEDADEPQIQVEKCQEVCAVRRASDFATRDEQDSHEKEAMKFVKNGSSLTKVRSLTRTYRRHYYVDNDETALRYKGSKKGQHFSCGTMRQRKPKQIISLRDIAEVRSEVRPGSILKRAHQVVVSGRGNRPSSAFTVVVGEAGETLDLVAPNAKEKEMWVKGLTHLVKRSKEASFYEEQRTWLNEKFQEVDVNNDGCLQLDEVMKFMRSINVCPKVTEELKDWCGKKVLSKPEFIELYEKLSRREELDEIFKNVSKKNKFIGPKKLIEFFAQYQNETLDVNEAKKLITDNEPCPMLKKQTRLSNAGFLALFSTERLNIKRPLARNVYHDMTQPLSHYFINSSHNTYLEKHQIVGKSSVEQYIHVLTHRCRCVEIDVWDGGDGEPVVYHGHTFTTKILFKDVLEGIKDYAFKKSQYPLILSLENHCKLEQQQKMANYLHQTFGEQLLLEPPAEDFFEKLPSPEALKNKVIVKGKKLPTASIATEYSDDEVEDEAAGIEDEEIQRRVKIWNETEQKHKLAIELSECVVICQATSFKDFETSATKHTAANISSFGEDKALQLSTNDGDRVEFVKHNKRQLSRIYPAGRRIDSSNYYPLPMWNAGCQVVALNFQTRDEPLLLNYGRFEDNGSCGYVLKPVFMRDPHSTFDPEGAFPSEQWRTLTVRVISGYVLPKKVDDHTSNILDPYVKVEVHGVKEDNVVHMTKVIQNNGFNPVWNQTLPPIQLHCPDLAIIQFKVCDQTSSDEDAVVAQYALPFNCIQTGYRMVALRDVTKGNVIGPTSLFVHISISEP